MPQVIIALINEVEMMMADRIRKIRRKEGVYGPHCRARNIIK